MNLSSPLRVGLIGAAGRWGPRAHVPALQGIPQAELYAMCTAHEKTARAAAEKFGVARAYGSDTALNADANVEEIARLMTDQKIKRVPVMRGDEVVGIVSRADIVSAIAQGEHVAMHTPVYDL